MSVEVMLKTLLTVYNLQPVSSGDFLLSHHHPFCYLDMGVLRSINITRPFGFVVIV